MKLDFKLESYLDGQRYNYDKIVKDFWATGYFSNKFDLSYAIMQFGRGKLLITLVMDAISRVLNKF